MRGQPATGVLCPAAERRDVARGAWRIQFFPPLYHNGAAFSAYVAQALNKSDMMTKQQHRESICHVAYPRCVPIRQMRTEIRNATVFAARAAVVLTLCAVVFTASCSTRTQEEGVPVDKKTAGAGERNHETSTHKPAPASMAALRAQAVVEHIAAYRAALSEGDSDNLLTTRLVAAHLSMSALKNKALMSENPLVGMVYAETLLQRAEDEATRSYARLRVAQHAAALYDFQRAVNELRAIPDDNTSAERETRLYEKYMTLAELCAELGDYASARSYASKLLNDPPAHAQNTRLRPALLVSAATCAAYVNDEARAQEYLRQAAEFNTDDPVVLMTVNNAKQALNDFHQFITASQATHSQREARRALYTRMASQNFTDVVREREAVVGRPLTAVERVQLLNRIKTTSPHYNP